MFGYNLDVINRSTSVARYSWLLNRKFKPRKFLHCAHNIVSEKIIERRGRDIHKIAEGHIVQPWSKRIFNSSWHFKDSSKFADTPFMLLSG